MRVAQLLQQRRRDGELVAAREREDLVLVAEGGAHHDGLVSMSLVVRVDAAHGGDARVLRAHVRRCAVGLRLVPVHDATHERRYERHLGFGARGRLNEAEEQSQIAVNALALQNLCGANAFERRRDLTTKIALTHGKHT